MGSCLTVLFCATVCFFISALAHAQQISGEYMETRSADVYTGQCFANGEVNLVGHEAILAWHVRSGGWDNVPLEGLSIAAAVRANGTLGTPTRTRIRQSRCCSWMIRRNPSSGPL